MPRVHSHYDNLKVARDAEPDAIRAAYRALTRQHHPDRNPDDQEAARIMALVNVAYSVLSDPARKREHDDWLRRSELEPLIARPMVHRTTAHAPANGAAWRHAASSRSVERTPARRSRRATWQEIRRGAALATIGGLALWGGSLAIERWQDGPHAVRVPTLVGPGDVPPPVASTPWTRSPLAPNGHPWPATSGYVEAYPQLNRTGLSQVVADNRGNGADLFVKLVSLDGAAPAPVRTFLVAARGRFVVDGITKGTYDLRWRNLSTGALMRTPPFILEEVSTARGMQPSETTIQMAPRTDGRPAPYALGDSDF